MYVSVFHVSLGTSQIMRKNIDDSYVRRDTHQYQSLAPYMYGCMQRSVARVIIYGDINTAFQKPINNPVLF